MSCPVDALHLDVHYLIEAKLFELHLPALHYSPLALQAMEHMVHEIQEAHPDVVAQLDTSSGLTVRVQAARFALFMALLLTERQRANMSLEEKRRIFGKPDYR